MKLFLISCAVLLAGIHGFCRADDGIRIQHDPDNARFFGPDDFRNIPVSSASEMTPICLEGDRQKAVVNGEGALFLYDVDQNGAPVGALCGTSVSVSLEGWARTPVKQYLENPCFPIVDTVRHDGEGTAHLRWRIFAVAPGPDVELPVYEPGPEDVVKLYPTTSPRLLPGWGKPGVPCIDAFRNIVAGFDCHIGYRFDAAEGSEYTVVLGFMESHHTAPGMRLEQIFIEGEKRHELDLIADIGRHVPSVFAFNAKDLDGDGFVNIDVKPAPGSKDQYPILNVLWVFAQDAPATGDLLLGQSRQRPLAVTDCGGTGQMETVQQGPARGYVILVKKRPSEKDAICISPSKTRFAANGKSVHQPAFRCVSASEPWERLDTGDLVFDERVHEAAVYVAAGHEAGKVDLSWARAQEERAKAYWSKLNPAFQRIRVPDPGIQALLDGSIRSLFQAARFNDGAFQFSWGIFSLADEVRICDCAPVLNALDLIGYSGLTQSSIEKLLNRWSKNGFSAPSKGGVAEPGIMLTCMTDHARLAGDRTWLLERWYVLQESMARIRKLRRMRLNLNQAGPVDEEASYAGIRCNLPGIKAALDAAEYVGVMTPETVSWEAEYEDLKACSRDADQRGLRREPDKKQPSKPDMMKPEKMPEEMDAAQALYAFAESASPLLSWCKDESRVPDIGACAEFIRLVRKLLVHERQDELHLLQGLPWSWTAPGTETVLSSIPTFFGPLSLEVRPKDQSILIILKPPAGLSLDRITLHLGFWAAKKPPVVSETSAGVLMIEVQRARTG